MPRPRGPEVPVSFEAVRRRGAGSWLVTWRIGNATAAPITVVEAWHPHPRFHGSRLRRSLRVRPGASASLEAPARMDALPGDMVENCFLILRVASGRERRRVLARFTVRVGGDGTPRLAVQAVDVQDAER